MARRRGPGTVRLDGRRLSVEQVVRVARGRAKVAILGEARRRAARSHATLLEAAREGTPIYGLNRGVGYFKDRKVSPQVLRRFNKGLVLSHMGGVGPEASEEEVRAMMVVRLNTLLHGHSGCSDALLEGYRDFLNHGLHPVVPLRGSVGAADITCLAYIGQAFLGEGHVRVGGERRRAREALAEAGLAPVELGPKDALAVVSSNALSAGLASLMLFEASALVETADLVYALSLEGFGGNLTPLYPQVQAVRPYLGQAESAARVRAALEGSWLHQAEPVNALQDPLSYRTAVHVHGAVRDALRQAHEQLAVHLNASEDNPCVLEEGLVVPTGNFDPLAWVLPVEGLGVALCHLARASCRRMLRIAEARFTGLPQYLAPGDETGVGLAEIQKTFASLLAEARHLANPASLDDLSLAGDLEDRSANAPLVVRKTAQILDTTAYILGIEVLHAARAVNLRVGKKPGKGTRRLMRILDESLSFRSSDRNLSGDLQRAYRLVKDGLLLPG